MAIREAVKAHIAFPSGEIKNILEVLQQWGFLEIYSKKDIQTIDIEELRQLLLKLQFIVEYLQEIDQSSSTWEKLKKGLPKVGVKQLRKIKEETDIHNDYEQLRESQKRLQRLHDRKWEALLRIEQLQDIKAVKLTGSQLQTGKTETIITLAGEAEVNDLKNVEGLFVQQISPEPPAAVAIVFLKKNADKVYAGLEKLKLHIYEIDSDKSPSEEIKSLKNLIEVSNKEIKSIRGKTKKICEKKLFNYSVLLDYYENLQAREEVSTKAISTDYTRVVSAWCPDDLKEELTSRLDDLNTPFHIEFEEPSPEDDPPVILKNRGFSESFEVVTDLYGTPNYQGMDPTPHLSWFFAFFFGLCLGDAGYGLILVGLSLWSIKFLKISASARKFMKLVLSSGTAAVIAGVLSGGYFGDALKGVGVVESLRIIDLMENPDYFLYFSIGLGFVQVVYGQFIAAFMKIKRGKLKESIYEDFSKIFFVIGISLLIVNSLALESTIVNKIALYTGALGVFGILFLSGHKAKSLLLRPLKGLGNLYGMTDYFKDMVSYSRIFALGMATAILGMAINEISKQLPDMVGVFAYIAIPVVLILGHLVINLLMSCLSAYVHTSRLQYVEFFTKFFEGGGRKFKPFRMSRKRVDFVQE